MEHNLFPQIVCFGEVLWDVLPGGTVPGGAPVNVAYHLQKQQVNTAVISRIGADPEGAGLVEDVQITVSPAYKKTDTDLAEAVLNALKLHTGMQEEKIKIKVEDGIVTLHQITSNI